ncbi:glutathionylspermidine synthase family protein [Paenibacillus thalictri]|uniref:Glutathionylspermidine synthase n=1 Tax=Paenibacillus thalictri TaxID=2527873 RepID=A0A4Q9DNL9_9BACL|nr:glutathionylspermidine synthase family protein [Paenibacillus thalictri]TBL77676.1 glutathionylspermidine synthase [Paenibacillus thalictri]
MSPQRQRPEYQAVRERLYGSMREEGTFTWDMMYGEEYALAGLHRADAGALREIRQAAASLGAVIAKTVGVIQQADDTLLLELGIPHQALGACRISVERVQPTVIGRFDFAVTRQGVKMLEFNSDTPTGIVEAFYANSRICSYYGAEDPNRGMEAMFRGAFERIVDAYRDEGRATGRIVFSSLDWHEEDAGTTRYLLRQSGLAGTFVPLSELRVQDDLLKAPGADGQLQPVDVLYRLHALEKLAEECDEDGYPTGAHVLDLIARRRLAVINPPSGFVAQTKALQALIWSLHESGEFYDPEEQEAIEAYMLPTYLDRRPLAGQAYVQKPIFGREGGGVAIYDPGGDLAEKDAEPLYWDQPAVFQQYTELPDIEMETLDGLRRGKLLWGCFYIGGEPSAVIARMGGRITNNMSYYVPVGAAD